MHKISAADEEFRLAFEGCSFPASGFDHRAHLRLAYVYLCEGPVETAHGRMRSALNAFLHHLGVDDSKYHETMTRSWILAVAHFMARTLSSVSADEFIDANPILLDSKIMLTHYSAELLFSASARAAFVEPDLEPILRHA